MTPERYEEILETLRLPEMTITLSPNPTTMGPSYVGEKIAEILNAQNTVNDLAEEVELAYTEKAKHLNDLETERDALFDIALIGLSEDETEGMDATARHALARKKMEDSHRLRVMESVTVNNSGPLDPRQIVPLRTKIKNTENEVSSLKVLTKILERKRSEFQRLDSGVRLQLNTIQTEVNLYQRGEPSRTSRGKVLSRTQVPTGDSVDGENDPTLVGSEDFTSLTGESK